MESPITFCISTYNNLNYLKLAVKSVRRHSYFKDAPFIIHAENCDDGTNEWLTEVREKYNLTTLIEPNNSPVKGIGGGMNICAENVKTKYIMFLHSDFYVSKDWDINLLKFHESKNIHDLWTFSYRIQPNIFNEESRYGTVIVEKDAMGCYHNDFSEEDFLWFAAEFSRLNDTDGIPKGEGVSGLILKSAWDKAGGNDPIFAPSSYEDMDLFLRMRNMGYKFYITSKSVVWHFGARGSHRLEENNGQTSQRQKESEFRNLRKWIDKWGRPPQFDEWGMITNLK